MAVSSRHRDDGGLRVVVQRRHSAGQITQPTSHMLHRKNAIADQLIFINHLEIPSRAIRKS
jgi:hypothetical protein